RARSPAAVSSRRPGRPPARSPPTVASSPLLPRRRPGEPTRRAPRVKRPLVAPVEVSGLRPETLFHGRRSFLGGVLAGPRGHGRPGTDDRLLAVHRLLEPSLLFRLEERVIVERILGLVVAERHGTLELRVPLLQLEVVLNDLREQRLRINRHRASWLTGT